MISDALCLYNDLYFETAKHTVKLFPEVLSTLKRLRKSEMFLGIATNESRRNLDRLSKELGIAPFIHKAVCHDEVIKSKPSPDMAVQILNDFGVTPQESLVVGDSILDIDMGKAAGCRTCCSG